MAIGKSKARTREALWGYLMISPAVIGLGIFFYITTTASLVISFMDWDLFSPPEWVGFQNYLNLFQDKLFFQSLWNTFRYTLMVVPLGQVVSLVLAILLNNRIHFQKLYRLIFFLPVLTMPVAIAIVWKWVYNPAFGLLAYVFKEFGLEPIKWLTDVRFAMLALVIVDVWMNSGYNMVIFLAGLQNVPRHLYEAAQIDGATGWDQLRYITLPMLTPTIFFTLITSMITAFQAFDLIFVMTKGGPVNTTRTLVYSIYREGFHSFRMGYASAISWVLLIIILLITLVQMRMQRKWVHYQ